MGTLDLSAGALSREQREEFAQTFLDVWMANGFGSLSKRDTEVLVFSCLRAALDPGWDRSVYAWAKALKISPTRVKSLMLESHLKFGGGEDVSSRLLRFFSGVQSFRIHPEGDKVSLSSITLEMLIEDPVIKMEVEQAIKELGGLAEYGINREILKMDAVTFFRVVNRLTGAGEDALIQKLARQQVLQRDVVGKLTKEVEGAAYAKLTEGGKAVAFLTLLADTFAEKPAGLVKYIKTIASSQKYHKKQ